MPRLESTLTGKWYGDGMGFCKAFPTDLVTTSELRNPSHEIRRSLDFDSRVRP